MTKIFCFVSINFSFLAWEGSLPGVYYLPNLLSEAAQLKLAATVLKKWVEPPNNSNLTPQESVQSSHYWKNNCDKNEKLIETKQNIFVTPQLQKLRWVTLGYQYDWGARKYEKTQTAGPVPPPLVDLCKEVSKKCGIQEELVVDAGIINFYHAKRSSDRLGGHRDDVEADNFSPLVSISLGLPGVFLLGGSSRASRPKVLVLRAGDVLVLSGRARQAYHGIPVVLSKPDDQHSLDQTIVDKLEFDHAELATVAENHSDETAALKSFLNKTRINLSMRRV